MPDTPPLLHMPQRGIENPALRRGFLGVRRLRWDFAKTVPSQKAKGVRIRVWGFVTVGLRIKGKKLRFSTSKSQNL